MAGRTTQGTLPIRIERRPGDFDREAPVPASGACCCCCCLHWVGAAAGGLVTIPWTIVLHRRRMRREPRARHPMAPMAVTLGAVGGVLLNVVLITVLALSANSGSPFAEAILAAFVLVPSLVFPIIGGSMMLGAWILKRTSRLTPGDDSGVYCPGCRYDLRAATGSTCPECGMVLRHSDLVPGFDCGIRGAWRFTWLSFLLASLLSGVGYLIMIPMFS